MFSISSMKRGWAALLGLALFLWGFAYAAGPVNVASLPGGGSVVSDSDTGNGQAWGRAGGRTVQYHVNNPAGFDLLKFGIVNGTVPSLAFDGTVTPSTSELMGFTAGASDLNNGIVVFTGAATLNVVTIGTFTNLPTRFTMRFTRASNNAPIPVTFDAGGVSPGADVLATGDFKVNLLFEMFNASAWGGNNGYAPVLDLYDSLATPPGAPPSGNTGPVMTGVTTGFYYTEHVAGMSIEEHDAHVTALFGGLTDTKTRIQFMYEDWPLRWNGIQGQVQDVSTAINNDLKPTLQQVQSQLTQLIGGLGGNNAGLATKQDTDQIYGKVDSVNQILMLIMGFGCPQGAPPGFCASFKPLPQIGVDINSILIGLNNANGKLDSAAGKLNTLATQSSVDGILIGLNNATSGLASQASVNGLDSKVNALSAKIDALQDAIDSTAGNSLDVRAVQIDSSDPKKLRWLVKITRDGTMVNASLTRFMTVRTPGAAILGNVMNNAVVVTLAPGLLDVTMDLVKNVTDGAAYLFEASLTADGATLHGSALNILEKKGASPF
jgi:hypothetical protein